MDDATLRRMDLVGKALFLAAVAVLIGSVVGAIIIGTSSTRLLFIGQFQKQNRHLAAAIAFAAGFIGCGLLAGMGALVRLQVAAVRGRD